MPSLFSLYIILLIPLYFIVHPIVIAPILLYLAIIIIYSMFLSIRKNILYFPLLPFLFLSVHLSYGLGMIYSQLKGK